MKRCFRFFLVFSIFFSATIFSKEPYIHEVSDTVRRADLEREARIERMVMVPMRDGVRLATRIYIPKNTKGKVPVVFWRTPYNFSELNKPNDERPSAYLKFALDAVRHGYAFVIQNERGKFFSEGDWEILGFPRTDGYDALSWLAKQPWSSGKIATVGCSSTAEWQLALASLGHPAHAAAVPMAYGAGIGRVGEFYEQGNLYRGGVIQQPMISWMFNNQNTQRPKLDAKLSREDRIRLSKFTDLNVQASFPNSLKPYWHLPMSEMYEAFGGPKGAWVEMASRGPDHPDWYKSGLFHDNEDYQVPTLWINSWFDLSTAPNLEVYNYVRSKASKKTIRNQQYLIIAPTTHCGMYRLTDPLIVGDLNMGNADFQFDNTLWDFLDYYTKGKRNGFKNLYPKVRYFSMGANKWQKSQYWPPKGSQPVTYYLDSEKGANSIYGDGILSTEPADDGFDAFTYDPNNPVLSLGGNLWGGVAGSYDNRSVEARQDVLVYTSKPFKKRTEVSGKIRITLYVSSDVKDTDFMVKLLDVYPDGSAYNLDETAQRVRYREGYDKEVFMEEGKVYRLEVSPITTSNIFLPGHRLRVEVSSSSFPRFQRNLNLGTDNFTETKFRAAHNKVHHTKQYASKIVIPMK